jgi:hypothetical protein
MGALPLFRIYRIRLCSDINIDIMAALFAGQLLALVCLLYPRRAMKDTCAIDLLISEADGKDDGLQNVQRKNDRFSSTAKGY